MTTGVRILERGSSAEALGLHSGLLSPREDVALEASVATLIIPKDLDRKEVLITNLPANTAEVRLGDANVSATRGLPLAKGATAVLTTSSAIWGFTTASESVAVAEML